MPEPSNEGTRRKIYSSEGHLEGGAGVQWFGGRSDPVREQRCTICLVFRRGRVSMQSAPQQAQYHFRTTCPLRATTIACYISYKVVGRACAARKIPIEGEV